MSAEGVAPVVVPLDDRLCLAVHRAARAMDAAYRPLLDPLDLTYPQHLVLAALVEGGVLGVRDLGRRLGLASNTLSPLLARLEARALVVRTRSAVDERRVDVALTPTGAELARRSITAAAQVSCATGMTGAEQEALVAALHRLEATLIDDSRVARD